MFIRSLGPAVSFLSVFLLVKLHVRANVFTSTDRLKSLITLESELLEAVKSYIDEEAKSARDVEEKWIEEYEKLKSLNKASVEKPNFTENPVNSFHLLNRVTQSWQPLVDYIVCEECQPWETVNAINITHIYKSAIVHGIWPTDVDCKGAALALVRLSGVYSLDLSELLDGRIYDSQTDAFTDEEVLRIVMFAEESGLSYECLKWLSAGVERALKREDKKSAIRFYTYTSRIYSGESMPWKALEVIQVALKLFPNHKGLNRDFVYYQGKAEKIPEDERNKEIKRVKTQTKVLRDYEALCSGRKGNKKRGLCHYKKTRIPIYLVKEEILSMDPRISMLYNVIYDREIQYVKKLGLEKLYRSIVVGPEKYSENRISQSAWLEDSYVNILKLTHRVELMTGLSLTARSYSSDSELLQVLNYGIGGMYEPHVDFFNVTYFPIPNEHKTLAHSGDRLATFLFYLNDVTAGGATVFPVANIRVPVVKGAAAFWFNLKRTSEGDYRTEHAGCPVLLGSKWVCNKWIRLNGNMFNAKCGLNPDSKYDL